VKCVDKAGNRNKNFSVYHVKIEENRHRLPAGYIDGLSELFDEVEIRRLVHGEWIDRVAGDGLFVDYFKKAIHVKGDALAGRGLMPDPRFLSVIAYDIGPMWPAISFMQLAAIKGSMVWIVYDEIFRHGDKTLYKLLAKEVIAKMLFWNRMAKANHGKPLDYMHITDESAINQWRGGGDGSYDAWEFEKEYRAAITEFDGDQAKLLAQMRLIGCPKGPGSVEARVRLLQSKLFKDEVYISATCRNHIDMLEQLKGNADNEPIRGTYIHQFDAMTYGMLKMEVSRNLLPSAQVAPSLIQCGSR
jgi:hypothetical protein